MTESRNPYAPQDDDAHRVDSERELTLPQDLPPVEPPSAGLIVQLFLVPAVIVAVIVGVYALFGQLASQELDWRQLATDVRSENPHVRWRGALGLAQMLDADAQRGESSRQLAGNPEIASALADLYRQLIEVSRPNEEELKQIEFLSKGLGRMTVEEVIAPVFREGIHERRNREVRKHSLIGLAMLAGRVREQGETLEQPGLVEEIIQISRESEPLFRHQSAYVLGLIPTEEATQRLEVLLEDANQITRINAAIALARNGSVRGVPAFQELLEEAVLWEMNPSGVTTQEEEAVYFERMLMLNNTLTAIGALGPRLDGETVSELVQQLDELAGGTKDAVLRTGAKQLLYELREL